MAIANLPAICTCRPAWNKEGARRRAKAPVDAKTRPGDPDRLEIVENHRDLTLFELAIVSKIRGCDLEKREVAHIYRKTGNLRRGFDK